MSQHVNPMSRHVSVDHPWVLLDVMTSSSNAATCQYLGSKVLVFMPQHMAQCRGMQCSFAFSFLVSCSKMLVPYHDFYKMCKKRNYDKFA